MQIGELAKASGVTAKMVRHYESIGLIGSGPRRANGYRDYGSRDVHELRFIRSARDLGFSLDEIGALLGLWRDKSRRSHDVRELAKAHLKDIERRQRELASMATTLEQLVHACHGDDRPDCPIIDELGRHFEPEKDLATSKKRR